MRFTEILQMCFRNLIRRKSRTFLTVIGVVIGTCAIIVMVSLGIGLKDIMTKQLEAWGDLRVIQIYNWSDEGGDVKLDDDTLASFAEMEGVDCVTPMCDSTTGFMVTSGQHDRYTAYAEIAGLYPDALEKMNYELLEGEYIKNEKMGKTIPVLVGEDMAYQFTDTKRPEGSNFIYYGDYYGEEEEEGAEKPEPFVDVNKDTMYFTTMDYGEEGGSTGEPFRQEIRVVGILKKDYSKDYRTGTGIFMSVDNLRLLEKNYNRYYNIKQSNRSVNYNQAYIHVEDMAYAEAVTNEVQAQGFEAYSMETERKAMEQTMMGVQAILGGLGAISLFVAAIGITNTMVMSIYERTKEIGVMKALGCYVRDIRMLFLMEAAGIGLLGGIIGILLSFLLSFILNVVLAGAMSGMMGGEVQGNISIIPLWLVLAAMLFSTMVGVLAGFLPAKRATKISALEAIRSAE